MTQDLLKIKRTNIIFEEKRNRYQQEICLYARFIKANNGKMWHFHYNLDD